MLVALVLFLWTSALLEGHVARIGYNHKFPTVAAGRHGIFHRHDR